jgi:CubicO group peptidase (beta-lactamase class C family)
VAKYLPEFGANGKEAVTIRELLTHTSGLREDLDLSFEWTGRGTAYRMAMAERPMRAPGSHFAYSDINYIVLGFVVEKLSGLSLDEYATRRIFAPLGMTETRYLPPAEWRARIASMETGCAELCTIPRRSAWAA